MLLPSTDSTWEKETVPRVTLGDAARSTGRPELRKTSLKHFYGLVLNQNSLLRNTAVTLYIT